MVCMHEPCTCQVANDETYCSSYCQEAVSTEMNPGGCECGHLQCEGTPI